MKFDVQTAVWIALASIFLSLAACWLLDSIIRRARRLYLRRRYEADYLYVPPDIWTPGAFQKREEDLF